MDSKTLQNKMSPEDFTVFAADLRRMIEAAPPGYQSRFARVIAQLQENRVSRIEELKILLHPKAGEQVDYDLLLHTLFRTMKDPVSNRMERFEAAKQLAQLRAEKPQVGVNRGKK